VYAVAHRRRATLLALASLGAGALAATAPARAVQAGTPPPGAPACSMLPADNVWNTDISSLPVNSRSSAWISSMGGPSQHLHPDFGPSGTSTPYGIPYQVVTDAHQFVNVSFQYASESDPGPYPLGPDTPIENGSDAHALVVDSDTCTLYETFATSYQPNGQSTAGSGAIFDLRSDALRPDTWTSADAAGLPMLPGLIRRDEVVGGQITHAIRFTASQTDTSHLWPARHDAGSASNPSLPPMGARFRLRSNVDISGFLPETQVVLRAMQHYGLILADNGSDWYFGGAAENGWDNSVLDQIKSISAGDFDAVDESSLMISPDSGQARQPNMHYDQGYWMAGADGGVFPFGRDAGYGSTGNLRLNQPMVGMAATPDGGGYWLVASDGGVFPFGDAAGYGSTGSIRLNQPIVGMAATPTGNGYWLVAADGGIFPFGDATGWGSTGGIRLNRPIVGMAAVPPAACGRPTCGYWLVASDGGIFPFGPGATGWGSTGGIRLNQPIVGVAAVPDGSGYWLVAADGGIFPFGPGAGGYGSTGSIRLNQPIIGIAASPDGRGYWLAARDGGIFPFGDAVGIGSTGGIRLNAPMVGLASH
jgi:hypothetical protein